MARTLDEIRASKPQVDRKTLRATTEADIRRHMIEDGHDPDAPVSAFVTRRPGQRGPGRKPAKVVLNLRVEPDILDAYRATGEGWQARMNDALRRGIGTGASRTADPKRSGGEERVPLTIGRRRIRA